MFESNLINIEIIFWRIDILSMDFKEILESLLKDILKNWKRKKNYTFILFSLATSEKETSMWDIPKTVLIILSNNFLNLPP